MARAAGAGREPREAPGTVAPGKRKAEPETDPAREAVFGQETDGLKVSRDRVGTREMEVEEDMHGEDLETRIAIVMSGRKVSAHFGKAEEIMLIEVVNGDIKDREILDAPPHECGALPDLLKEKGVRSLVAGSIGARAMEYLHSGGIRVYSGAKGSVEDALGSLLSGRLISSETVCEGGMGTCDPETDRTAEVDAGRSARADVRRFGRG